MKISPCPSLEKINEMGISDLTDMAIAIINLTFFKENIIFP